MRIRNILHKPLRRLVEHDETKGLDASLVSKILRILSFLEDMQSEKELENLQQWNAHRLVGSRSKTWSLSVSRNWRITFWIDDYEIEIVDLNYEDYH